MAFRHCHYNLYVYDRISIEDAATMLGISAINLRRYFIGTSTQEINELCGFRYLEKTWLKTIPIDEIFAMVYEKYLL